MAVAMGRNGHLGADVPDYVDENVSTKVIKIIQSYTLWSIGGSGASRE